MHFSSYECFGHVLCSDPGSAAETPLQAHMAVLSHLSALLTPPAAVSRVFWMLLLSVLFLYRIVLLANRGRQPFC